MARTNIFAVLFLLAAMPLVADDEKRLLVSSAFGDPSLVAPVVRYDVDRGNGTSWAMGISGWTVDGEWTKRVSDARAFRITADITPLNAHNSNLMYVDGERAEELDYDNMAQRVRGGMRFNGARTTTDVMLVALYESVSGLPQDVMQRWGRPYAGLEVAHTYSVMNSREPLVAAFDGVEITGRAEVLAGTESWTRVAVTEQAGRNVGRFHFRQSVTLLHGNSLDTVNRFIVGGSWDALGGTAVYGLRYGELRLERGLIASGGADVRLGGNWRVGIRGSYVDGDDDQSTYGHALNASTTWKTIGANFGVGFSERADTTVYGALIVPLYRR